MVVDGFSTATEMLAALRDNHISAVELLDLHIQRIERHDGRVNAVVIRDFERARKVALAADALRARGEDRPLLGLPVTIKDGLDVTGLATTGGLIERADAVAEADAPVVARLRAAGAVIVGKTNVPPNLADWQTGNPIFGRTNNPWDLDRTPGGSSGGSGAALAAGLTPLDLGSDKGGSIRFPAAWCGVFGHRPSFGMVPSSGHFPGSSHPNETLTLNAVGPLARSADDLELALNVIAGPDVGLDAAWRLELPPARHARLSDFPVAVLPGADWRPVDGEITGAIEEVASELRRCGTHVAEALPPELGDLREHHELFQAIGTSTTSEILNAVFDRAPGSTPTVLTEAYRRERAATVRAGDDPFAEAIARGIEGTVADFVAWHDRRERYRAAWRAFFRDWDVLLAPIVAFPAPAHSTLPFHRRTALVNGQEIGVRYAMTFASLPIVAGLPATAVPLGLSRDGLPIGVQVIGPFLEDRTPIQFARLVAERCGGFRRPPGFN